MASRTIVITGASDGIGAAAARRLHTDGHEVVLVGRSADKTAAIADELGSEHHVADFAELEQVRALAAALQAAHPRIDVLASNAGGIMGARAETVDGFERTLQVNHLAPFLLTHLLMPTLAASRASVIQTASIAARLMSALDVDDLQNERAYAPERAYGDAKLANILFVRELARRHGEDGIAAAAFHPGIVGTGFASETTSALRVLYRTPVIRRLATVSPERGADTLVWLAKGTAGTTWQSGRYYARRRLARSTPRASDDALAAVVWNRTAAMLGLDADRPQP